MALDAAVGDERDVRVGNGKPAFEKRLHLRHTKTRGHPGRTAPFRADTHFDAISAALEQKLRAFGGRYVAGDHFSTPKRFRNSPIARSMATDGHPRCRYNHVHVRAKQLTGAFQIVAGRADGRADAQAALAVAGRKRHTPLPQRSRAVIRPSGGRLWSPAAAS